MPAAAVIPAPVAYINIVAVKKLVVGFRDGGRSVALYGRCAVPLGVWPSTVLWNKPTAFDLLSSTRGIIWACGSHLDWR